MTPTPVVSIAGLGLWTAGYASAASWAARTPDPELTKPQGRALDRINRRRASPLGRAIAEVAAEAMEQAGVDPALIATVVGSSIGEASTMIGLLEQMWRLETPMSPAAFTVSVHNAASGLLSISSGNHGYSTSLAADHDTPAVALLEAISLVCRHGVPVLVVCADEDAPICLVKNAPPWDLLAAAVVVTPLENEAGPNGRLEVLSTTPATLTPADLPAVLANNPQAGMVDLVDALLRRKSGVLALDRGRGLGYVARLDFGERE